MKRHVIVFSSLLASLTVFGGCDMLQQFYNEPIEFAVELESPPIEVNVTEQVESAEADVCETEDETCEILKALDRSDDDQVGDPPRVPEEFPIEVPVEDEDGNAIPDLDGCNEPIPTDCPPLIINVADWAEEAGLFDDVDFRNAVPVDITEKFDVSSPDAIQGVQFEAIGLNWTDNSLTFDTVELDIYMTLDFLEDADADALIENGDVTYIGTLDRQLAETDGVTPINFADEAAKDLFTDGLLKLKFTLVTALPDDAELDLNEGATAGTRRKPLGVVDLSMVGTVTYTVTPSELVGDAKDAYNAGDFDI